MTRLALRAGAGIAGGLLLVALAIANAAGYRYGVSDQAFYLPSILHAVDPALYPRDAALLDAQGQLMVSDEISAWLITHTGVTPELLFAAGYLTSLVLMFAAVWLLARRFAAHRWTAMACCLAVTLRHRITETGANTFEGYYHPRGLAFACGVAAAAALSRERLGMAAGLVAVAMVLHPTTGLWWAVWMAAALLATRRRWHAWVIPSVLVAGVVGGAALVFTPLADRLRVMDAAWLLPLASKDYVFPNTWPAGVWLANLVLPVVVAAVWFWRRRLGVAAPWETGMVAGVCLLTGTFLLAMPLVAGHVALAVQLQVSRIFWVVDFFAVLGLTWLLAEGGGDTAWHRRRPAIVAGALLAVSAGRGVYITQVEHPERPFVQGRLEDSDWVRVGRWLATRTPVDTHVLADPDHDWKFGHSVRLTARRDVLVEGVKDAALSLYDRDVATRVQSRIEAVGDFSALDAPAVRALARRFDLDLLVIDRDLPLPEVHREGRFRVYRLQ